MSHGGRETATTAEPSTAIEGNRGVRAFARENAAQLATLESLLHSLPDSTYAAMPSPHAPASIGAHVRHVLDFHLCLLRGAAVGVVDYEHRDRDPRVEVERAAAASLAGTLRERLDALDAEDDAGLQLLVVDLDGVERSVRTSVLRELEAALSHAVHHFAIIAMILRDRGLEPPPHFGVAPSTLRYLRRRDVAR